MSLAVSIICVGTGIFMVEPSKMMAKRGTTKVSSINDVAV